MAHIMDGVERRAFLSQGTRTGKLATTRADGRPHVVPVWFVLDGDEIVFNTEADSVKGHSLLHDGRACLCVDDQAPPYSFVLVEGTVTVSRDPGEVRAWASRIAARYMGSERAEEFGKRNTVDGMLLVRLPAGHTLAVADTAL